MATEEAAVPAVDEASEEVVASVVVLVASAEAGNREVSEESLVSVTAAAGVAAVEVAATAATAGEQVVHMAEMGLMEAAAWQMAVALIALMVALAVALEEALEVVLEVALEGDRVKQEGVDTAAELDHSVDAEGY